MGEDTEHLAFAPLDGAYVPVVVFYTKPHLCAQAQNMLQSLSHRAAEGGARGGRSLYAGDGDLLVQACKQCVNVGIDLRG